MEDVDIMQWEKCEMNSPSPRCTVCSRGRGVYMWGACICYGSESSERGSEAPLSSRRIVTTASMVRRYLGKGHHPHRYTGSIGLP